MIKQYKLRFYNFRLVLLLIAISSIGVVLVTSARADLRNKQLVGLILGLVVMVILSLMDYSWILNFQWIMYGVNIVMLLGVRLFGSNAGGATRWLQIGGFRFQPTELSKIIIILFFAKFFMDHEEDLNTLKVLAEAAVLLAIPVSADLCTAGYEEYHYGYFGFLYSFIYGRATVPDHRRGNSDCNTFDHNLSFHRCAAGSEADPGLSEKANYVLPVS